MFLGIPVLIAANTIRFKLITLFLSNLVAVAIFSSIILVIAKKFNNGLGVVLPMMINIWYFALLTFTNINRIQNPNINIIKGVMIASNLISAIWMSFHPVVEGPTERETKRYMNIGKYIQLLMYFILISLKL